MAATIFDVARSAQVSHQTVSRVLKGDPTVGEVLRERVQAAVRELRYRPSAAARALASRRSRVLGLVVAGGPLYGPTGTTHGFDAAARAAGWDVVIEFVDAARDGDGDLAAAVDSLLGRDAQAIVLVAPTPAMHGVAAALDVDVPLLTAGRGADGLPHVAIDQRAGAVAIVSHLLALGHTRIAHLAGPADWFDAQDREEGWRAALAAAGLPAGPLLRGDWTAVAGDAHAAEIVAAGATAVFCANDQTALGLLHGLHAQGVRVPDDVSVAGFDDIPEAAFFTPALTTVRQDFVALGRDLLARVEHLVAGPGEEAVPTVPEVVLRASTAPPR